MATRRTISLITDYGLEGPFAGAMKGAILKLNPDVNIVDITHTIAPGNIREAAFILDTTFRYFPEGSIHVVVVDPNVGSNRRGLLVSMEGHFFVGPDNGVFSYILAKEDVYAVMNLDQDHFFLNPLSNTFHGRDVFAPVAGWLSKGIESTRLGTVIEDPVKLELPFPAQVGPKMWKGTILYVDHFGNLVTNLTTEHLPLDENGYPAFVKMILGQGEVTRGRKYFNEFQHREPFLLLGSSGYYEIAVPNDSAARVLGLKAGSAIGAIAR